MGWLRGVIFVLLAISMVGCGAERSRRLKWNLRTSVDDYSEVGRRDPKWNDNALKALKLFAQWRSSNAMRTEAVREQVAAASKEAVSAGCKDPLVLYVYARFVVNRNGSDTNAVAYAHRLAADLMKASDYHSLHLAYARMRAGEAMSKVEPTPKLAIAEMMNDAAIHLNIAMKDGDVPDAELQEAAALYFSIIQTMRVPRYGPWSELNKKCRDQWGKDFQKTFAGSTFAVD